MISSYCTTFLVKVMTVLTLELIVREGVVVVFGEVFVFRKTVRLAVGIWIRFWHKQRPPHICGPIFLVVELSGSRLLFRMSTSCPSGSRKGACDQHRMFRCSHAAFVKMPLTVPNMFQHVSLAVKTPLKTKAFAVVIVQKLPVETVTIMGHFIGLSRSRKNVPRFAFHTLHLAPATISPLCVIFEVKRQVGFFVCFHNPSRSGVAGGWAMLLEMIPNGSTTKD